VIPRATAVLALALASALAAPGPPALAAPRTAAVDFGGTRGYVRADQALALAGVELVVRAGLDRESTAQNGLAALVAEAVLQTRVAPAATVPGAPVPAGIAGAAAPLVDAVKDCGGSVSYAVGAQSVRFYLEGTPESLTAAAPLVARALAAPSFDAATLTAARAALADRIADDEADPRLVARAMLRSSYYRGGAGLPALGSASALAELTPADAQAFYGKWYRRGDAVVAAVGRTGDATDAASRALAAALPAGTAPAAALAARPFGAEPKRIVTHRDVGAPYVGLGFAAPALGERDFAAALVLRALLGSVFDRTTATTQSSLFRSAGTIYDYDAAPAHLVLWINGARVDPEVGLGAISGVAKAVVAKPVAANVLSRYKETARGRWALEALSLDERADAIGTAVTRGLDADASDDVLAAIGRVTAADVQRVAKKYFLKFDVALIIPRTSGS
jgi:predicted Zn-dependent peptidase